MESGERTRQASSWSGNRCAPSGPDVAPCAPPRPGGAGTSTASGFTLVEMLVAIVITAILGSAVVGLLLSQNRFYAETDDLVFAEQSLRASVELMASELRMASAGDVVEQTADAVTVRFDLVRGVVCQNNFGGNPVQMYVYDFVDAPNLTGTNRWTLYSNPGVDAWTVIDGWNAYAAGDGGNSAAALTICQASGDATRMPDDLPFYRELDWNGAVPQTGAAVRVAGPVRYRFAPSSFTSGIALWRGDQELAAPFAEGARFEYVMDGGVVTGIRIVATAVGEGDNRFDVSREIDYTIPLRN